MTAMSSNPRRFRSKGGDVGLSELAFHDDERGMYDAAQPCIMWGGRLRVITTHNGENSFFNQGIIRPAKRAASGEVVKDLLPFSIHRVTILDAVQDGLVEKINETKKTQYAREQFVQRLRAMCRNEDQWNQEYMAIPSTDSSAFLPYELIEKCEDDRAGRPEHFGEGPRYVGMDVGESNNPSVIYWGERVGDVLWVRERIRLVGAPLHQLERMFVDRLNHPRTVRGCVDGTGLGTQIGQAAERTGRGESIKFTVPVKDELASPVRGVFEDQRVRIPRDPQSRHDLHSVRMILAANHPRFDAANTKTGHADEFWALALMLHAARGGQIGGMLTTNRLGEYTTLEALGY
jgi:phage FluMu gp28-like protein